VGGPGPVGRSGPRFLELTGQRGPWLLLISVAGAMLLGAVGFAPVEFVRGGSPRAVELAVLLTLSVDVIGLVAQTALIAFFVYEPAEARDRLVGWLAAAGVVWLPIAAWLAWHGALWQGPPVWTLRNLTAVGLPSIAALLGAAVLRRRA